MSPNLVTQRSAWLKGPICDRRGVCGCGGGGPKMKGRFRGKVSSALLVNWPARLRGPKCDRQFGHGYISVGLELPFGVDVKS